MLVAVLVAASPAWAGTPNISKEPQTFGARHGCPHLHRSSVAYKRIGLLVRNVRPRVERHRVQHYATCLASRAKAHHAHELARAYWRWRHAYPQYWRIRLNRLPASWVRWARNITFCESRWDRYASNGSHFGWFQWAPSTWAAASAGFDPRPIYETSWPHMAVIAIHWAQVAGTSQWVCKG